MCIAKVYCDNPKFMVMIETPELISCDVDNLQCYIKTLRQN